jgi:hypothetical protein
MKQYIDKAAVVAELERLYNLEYDNTSSLSCGKKIMLRNILLFLDTLEVKEINSTDAFIEKAWEWIENNMLSSNQQDKSRLYFELFKSHVKGE